MKAASRGLRSPNAAAATPSPSASTEARHENGVVAGKLNLSELVGIPVLVKGGAVGKLDDLVIVDKDRYAEVTHLVAAQPFGRPSLVIPWEKVASFEDRQVLLSVDEVKSLASVLPPSCSRTTSSTRGSSTTSA